jgi:hypothetical protein
VLVSDFEFRASYFVSWVLGSFMSKRVLDVGNCVPDHAAIRRLLETTFHADVVPAPNH